MKSHRVWLVVWTLLGFTLTPAFAAADDTDREALDEETTDWTARPQTIDVDEEEGEGESGPTFRLGALMPTCDCYADGEAGMSLEIGYWIVLGDFALEPRSGVRFDVESGGGRYIEVPIDIVLSYLIPLGDVSPLIGLGGGAHFMYEERPIMLTTGEVFQSTSHTQLDQDAWGFTGVVRAGVALLRSQKIKLNITVEYSISFFELNGRSYPQALHGGIAIVF